MTSQPDRRIACSHDIRLSFTSARVDHERTGIEMHSANMSFQRAISPKFLDCKTGARISLIGSVKKEGSVYTQSKRIENKSTDPTANSIPDFQQQLRASGMLMRINKHNSAKVMNFPTFQAKNIPRILSMCESINQGNSEVNSTFRSQCPVIMPGPDHRNSQQALHKLLPHSLRGINSGDDTSEAKKQFMTFEDFKRQMSRNSVKDYSPKPILKTRSKLTESINTTTKNCDAIHKQDTKSLNVKFSKQIIYYRFNPN
jgi:hypothetical protein